MAELYDSIKTIKGIGDTRAKAFASLGVESLYDLLSFFPRRYEDRTSFVPIALTGDGDQVCISAVAAEEPRLTRIRKGLDVVKFKAADESGIVDITYFNQSWMKNNIHRGEEYVFFGKIQASGRHRTMANPVFEKSGKTDGVTGRIIPVYRLCKGLNQKAVLQSIRCGLDSVSTFLPEIIPEETVIRQQLCRVTYAYENIHFPSDFSALENARRRLVFEELFVLACALGKIRSGRIAGEGIRFFMPDISEFYASLPFSPTRAQRRAIDEALKDMCSGLAMNRLVQGDVGSGKTLVAAALIWAAFKNGYSSAFMAPTEILAEQHTVTMQKLLSPFGIEVLRLTGSMTSKEKREVKIVLASGKALLAVGTHALLSSDVEYSNLGLVVTDEQHRFGVNQRSALIEKASGAPHVMVMSATPIPRTLALIIYGDLDVSIIDELPPGRQKVDTFSVNSSYRERLNAFIRKQAANGNQTYIVCPMVEDNDDPEAASYTAGLKSAEELTAELRVLLPELNIECVHGRMKAKEKEALMNAFSAGEIDVLVATTVIEVGVDVPNATLMIIENAERFGLSQLHQLRGRVGRGKNKSYCVLVSDAEGEDVKARLDIMCKTNDGFKISEEDLRLRGPGDFFGSRQHGLPEMHLADLGADTNILKAAQDEAKSLLSSDPELTEPNHRLLHDRIEAMLKQNTSFN